MCNALHFLCTSGACSCSCILLPTSWCPSNRHNNVNDILPYWHQHSPVQPCPRWRRIQRHERHCPNGCWTRVVEEKCPRHRCESAITVKLANMKYLEAVAADVVSSILARRLLLMPSLPWGRKGGIILWLCPIPSHLLLPHLLSLKTMSKIKLHKQLFCILQWVSMQKKTANITLEDGQAIQIHCSSVYTVSRQGVSTNTFEWRIPTRKICGGS